MSQENRVLSLEFDTSDLNLKPEPPDNVLPTAIELSKRIIIVAVREYGAQHNGLLKPERKQAKWLHDELEKASATELKSIEVPPDIFGFLRKVFRETRLPAMDKAFDRCEQNIDDVKVE